MTVYQQSLSRSTPGCIVFLVDRSESMKRPWGDSGLTLAHGAARAINKILLELCVKSIKEQAGDMRLYFYVGIYGYGYCPGSGTEGVESALPGALARRAIVPLPELADNPLAVREEPSIDSVGPASKVPVWVEPAHGYRTPMCEAMAVAGEHVYEWSQAFPYSHPAIIINLTDGWVTDSPYQGVDARGWASRLTTISTRDGQALFLNAFLAPGRDPMTAFPATPAGLPDPGPELFAMSSPLPESMIRNAKSAHVDVPPGGRGLVFNADLSTLVTFLEIGTRVEVRHD
jgi:hypothetical protein